MSLRTSRALQFRRARNNSYHKNVKTIYKDIVCANTKAIVIEKFIYSILLSKICLISYGKKSRPGSEKKKNLLKIRKKKKRKSLPRQRKRKRNTFEMYKQNRFCPLLLPFKCLLPNLSHRKNHQKETP